MKHHGDITKINGVDLEPVWIVTGGSPCQDLSVAGKREGLAGERSGLFMEQIRIIKEMRNECFRQLSMRGADVDFRLLQPRYMVWENVAGAFSSNKGEDFRIVLEETAKVADKDASVPRLEGGAKWSPCGCIMGDWWSIAWRVHDAQFWGVPQRRKRISLVADFGGESAPEILFERKSLSRAIEQSGEKRETVTADFKRCPYDTSYTLKVRGGAEFDSKGKRAGKGALVQTELSATLGVSQDQTLITFSQDAYDKYVPNDKYPTIKASGGVYGGGSESLVIGSLCARDYKFDNGETRMPTVCVDMGGRKSQCGVTEDVTPTLATTHGGEPVVLENHPMAMENNSIVRRLTPLECERLQGFPDGWTDIGEWTDSKGKKHKDVDSPRYKALGNSIALPFWEWMADRMVKHLDVDKPTMGSLFDGIGGFPLVFSRAGCIPVWASEIEEFPIAVTKERFGNE